MTPDEYEAWRSQHIVTGKKLNGRFAIADNDDRPVLAGIGDPVWINAFGRWYAGEIIGIGRSRLRVSFETASGNRRIKLVAAHHTGLIRARTNEQAPQGVTV